MEVNCYEWDLEDVTKWMREIGFRDLEGLEEKIRKLRILTSEKGNVNGIALIVSDVEEIILKLGLETEEAKNAFKQSRLNVVRISN